MISSGPLRLDAIAADPRGRNAEGAVADRYPQRRLLKRLIRSVGLDQRRGIGRFLGSGIRPFVGSSSALADACAIGTRLRIAWAASR